MKAAGWHVVAEGMLETYAVGERGFRWMREDLQAQYAFLLQEQKPYPSPELDKAIAAHASEIARMKNEIGLLRITAPLSEASPRR